MNSRNMIRTAALAVACLLGTAAVHAQAAAGAASGTKIGTINIRQAIVTTAEGKQASTELQSQFAAQQNELEALNKQINDLRQQLAANQTTWGDEQKARVAAQGQKLTAKFDRQNTGLQEDVNSAQSEVVDRIGRKMMDVIERYARENGFVAVFEYPAQNTSVVYASTNIDITAFREKIEKAGPVLEANSQGNALARLFNLPEAKAATLSTYQNLAMALVIELLIVMSLVAGEVLEHHETQPSTRTAETLKAVPAKGLGKPVEAPSVVEALSPVETPKAFPAPARPRLITSRADPVGSVAVIMAEIMEPGRGKVEIADVFAAYAEACEASGKRPIPANEFPAAIAELCQRLGIEIEDNAKGVFLLKVRLKKGNENEGTFYPEVSNHDGA